MGTISINRGTRTARYLEIGDRNEADGPRYPDDDLAWGPVDGEHLIPTRTERPIREVTTDGGS